MAPLRALADLLQICGRGGARVRGHVFDQVRADKTMVYLSLGLMPFAIEALPRDWRPNIEWRGVPFITGVLTTIIQVLAGVGGLFLDIFFQKSMLDRKTTNATKATVQSLSHIVRIAYFGTVRAWRTCRNGRSCPPSRSPSRRPRWRRSSSSA